MMISTYSISFRGPVRGVCIGLTLTTLAAATALGQIPPPTAEPPNFADPVVFQIDPNHPAPGFDLAVGDLDGDGDDDVVVGGGSCASPCVGGVSVFLNDPSKWATDPTNALVFETALDMSSECGSSGCDTLNGYNVVVALLDGDALPDIAVSGTPQGLDSTGFVLVFLNDPSNPGKSFIRQTAAKLEPLQKAKELVAMQINSDGVLDIAVATGDCDDPNCTSITAEVTTFLNNGSGVLGNWFDYRIPNVDGSAWDLAFGDFDGDDFKPDIVTANVSHNSIGILHKDPMLGFVVETKHGPTTNPPWLFNVIAKGNTDNTNGLPELVGVEATVYLDAFRRDSAGALIHQRVNGQLDTGDNYCTQGDNMTGVRVGRVNGGAWRDVAMSWTGSGLEMHSQVIISYGLGDGTFERDQNGQQIVYSFDIEPPNALGSNRARDARDLIFVDLNDDGKKDIVTANAGNSSGIKGNISVLINETP